jgi:hypothetical protein
VPSSLLVRTLQQVDWDQVMETYADAVQTLAPPLYRPEQIQAWAAYPTTHAAVHEALGRGYGLVGTTADRPSAVEAFALLDPMDRLALPAGRGWPRALSKAWRPMPAGQGKASCAPRPANSPGPCSSAWVGVWRKKKRSSLPGSPSCAGACAPP